METVHIRAKECPENVIEVDVKNAGVMVERGTWELVEEAEGESDNGSRNTGRRNRATRANPAT